MSSSRRTGAIGILVVVLLVGALVPSSAAGRTTRPDWFGYDRSAGYGTHAERVQVPMRDGFELGCAIARPAVGNEPAAGRFPGILRSYTPYGRALDEVGGEFATYFSRRGYNVLSCDIRGTGISPAPGYEIGWPVQRTDGYDAVEWLAGQPWSTGRIGASGTSYGGQTTLEIAALQPPHLEAIAPNVSPMDVYRDHIGTVG